MAEHSEDVLFELLGAGTQQIGFITLNRPNALNALTHEMILAISQHLTKWAAKPEVFAVIIQANGERAFCAGGDIKKVYLGKQANDDNLTAFFWDEYRLNRQIHHYQKPYVALMDGITMGGGVGISLHGSHRIGTANFSFAMPETGIGFFPDIGGVLFTLKSCR